MKLSEILEELDIKTTDTAFNNMSYLLNNFKKFAKKNPDIAKNIDFDSDNLETNLSALRSAVEKYKKEKYMQNRQAAGTKIKVTEPIINKAQIVKKTLNRKIKVMS